MYNIDKVLFRQSIIMTMYYYDIIFRTRIITTKKLNKLKISQFPVNVNRRRPKYIILENNIAVVIKAYIKENIINYLTNMSLIFNININ